MDERLFYDERQEEKPLQLNCPSCRQQSTYPIRWIVRTKKSSPPRGISAEDRKKFDNARSYMIRVDDLVACRKCRKRIEITGQSVVLISGGALKPGEEFDPENFGNR
jgi:hypothetical protein